jgi:hypothetical protein
VLSLRKDWPKMELSVPRLIFGTARQRLIERVLEIGPRHVEALSLHAAV